MCGSMEEVENATPQRYNVQYVIRRISISTLIVAIRERVLTRTLRMRIHVSAWFIVVWRHELRLAKAISLFLMHNNDRHVLD